MKGDRKIAPEARAAVRPCGGPGWKGDPEILGDPPLPPARSIDFAGSSGVLLNRFSVAGFGWTQGPRLVARMRAGDPLLLRPEPENPHDPYAVRISWMRWKIGYVPRSDNRHLSRLLRQGVRLRAVVTEIDPGAADWRKVRVAVMMEREGEDRGTRRCPGCGGESIAHILWGLPAMSEKLREDLQAGRVMLGGCCVEPNSAEWHCNECGTEWRVSPIDPAYEP